MKVQHFPTILEELREIEDTQVQLAEDIEVLKIQFKREYGFISQTPKKTQTQVDL